MKEGRELNLELSIPLTPTTDIVRLSEHLQRLTLGGWAVVQYVGGEPEGESLRLKDDKIIEGEGAESIARARAETFNSEKSANGDMPAHGEVPVYEAQPVELLEDSIQVELRVKGTYKTVESAPNKD